VWKDLALKEALELRARHTNAPGPPLSTGLTGSDKSLTVSAASEHRDTPIPSNAIISISRQHWRFSTTDVTRIGILPESGYPIQNGDNCRSIGKTTQFVGPCRS